MLLATGENARPEQPRNAFGPDFLCVGMAKAGTAWLGDQLRRHPQFWMPPVQELGYLGRDAPALRSANRRLQRIRQRTSGKNAALPKNVSEADMRFLEEIAACTGQPRDIDKYLSLFRHKGRQLSGDISPGYSALEPHIIHELLTKMPAIRVVLLIRDPIERLWSHISMWHRNGKFDAALLNEPSAFGSYLQTAKMPNEASSPTQTVAHWSQFLPPDRFRYFFFDDIVARPDSVRCEIIAFLGADPDFGSGDVPADYNRKSQSAKLTLTAPIKALLVEHCAKEISACARVLGGSAITWVTRYGL
jgi:hypothetical protein